MTLLSEEVPTQVVVFGGDPVVGRGLELLIRSAGYSTSFVTEESFDASGLVLGGQILLFLALGMSPERREACMSLVAGSPGLAGVPILELVWPSENTRDGTEHQIPWPCRVDELIRRIEAALVGVTPQQKRR